MKSLIKNILSLPLNENRVYGLDILRAIAILFVVAGHGRYLLPESFQMLHHIFIFDGVSIFFVLSGFLIGGILIKLLEHNEVNKELIAGFWIRRWFRTLPNYYLVLFILIGFNFYSGAGLKLVESAGYVFFAQNLFYPHPDFFPEAWSLSVEEWFYLITPVYFFLLIRLLKIRTGNAVFIASVSVILMIIFLRMFRFSGIEMMTEHDWARLFRKQVVTRLDSLMPGVMCGYISYYHKAAWIKHKKALLFLGIFIFLLAKTLWITEIISRTGFYNSVISFSITSLATALLLPYLSELRSGSGKIYEAVTRISLISYSMYLLNLSVVQTNILNRIPWSIFTNTEVAATIMRYTAYWIMTIIFSLLLYKHYEKPMTDLRDHEAVKRFTGRLLKS